MSLFRLLYIILMIVLFGPRHGFAQDPHCEASSTVHRWSVGNDTGLGARWLSDREIPTGVNPWLDLLVLDLRYALAPPRSFESTPTRFDVQLDWLHWMLLEAGSTRPRFPITVYATWQIPRNSNFEWILSPGAYTELGSDRFVVDEQLVTRPAGALGMVGRAGVEGHIKSFDAFTYGLYLHTTLARNIGSDPNHLKITRNVTFGLEFVTSFGFKKVTL